MIAGRQQGFTSCMPMHDREPAALALFPLEQSLFFWKIQLRDINLSCRGDIFRIRIPAGNPYGGDEGLPIPDLLFPLWGKIPTKSPSACKWKNISGPFNSCFNFYKTRAEQKIRLLFSRCLTTSTAYDVLEYQLKIVELFPDVFSAFFCRAV